MTPWDSDKSTAADPDNPAPDEQLSADEWDQHVADGHWPADQINFGVNASGHPILTDSQNADAVVAVYDRSIGSWILDVDGYAELNDQGTVLSSQVPDLAITETYTVADESERLALDVQEGDVAIQTDTSETYIFTGGDPTSDGDWSAFVTPPAPVQSVFGRTGDVVAESGDYAYSEISGTHGDSAHSLAYLDDGDGVKRRVWVIASGASDPAGAGVNDLIFEEEA